MKKSVVQCEGVWGKNEVFRGKDYYRGLSDYLEDKLLDIIGTHHTAEEPDNSFMDLMALVAEDPSWGESAAVQAIMRQEAEKHR